MLRSPTIAVAIALLAACGGEPLEFAPWDVAVSEETPVLFYPPVSDEERQRNRIGLVDELTLGDDPAAPEAMLYQPVALAVGRDGRMFVLDRGNFRIQVYDPGGAHDTNIGAQGEGPGELTAPTYMAMAGDRLVVQDRGLDVWGRDGDFLRSTPLETRSLARMIGLPDGSLLGVLIEFDSSETPPRRKETLIRVSDEGGELNRVTVLPRFGSGRIEVPHPRPAFAATAADAVYVTPAREYQVHRFTVDGDMLWALRVAAERQPLPREVIDAARPYHEALPEEERQVEWPERLPALRGLFVDGHGHLYVFPYVFYNELGLLAFVGSPRWENLTPPEPRETVPVDVYSADGERLFAGTIETAGQPELYWQAARDDDVYRIVYDLQTGQRVAQRLRLVEPF